MMTPLFRVTAILLAVFLVVPAPLWLAPERAHAQFASVTKVIDDTSWTAIKTSVETAFTAVKTAISAASDVATQVNTYLLMADKYVLEPLAFVVSGNLIKAITASVLKFINGETNGTGIPQFVQDLRGHLQGLGDIQTLAFLNNFSKNSNSPFASAITSSLRTNYLQGSSLEGFFAANQCTLDNFSNDTLGFLHGDWSQGGVGAWMALTTHDENNPYILHQKAQEQMYNLVDSAVTGRLHELDWGQGFLSWCGANAAAPASGTAGSTGTDVANGPTAPTAPVDSTNAGKTGPTTTNHVQGEGVDPGTQSGDDCLDKDGKPGTIKTPGSVIKDTLNRALGLDWNKLSFMGNVGPEVNNILGTIGHAMSQINFVTSLLGGSDSGGLAGANTAGNKARSALENYTSGNDYLGVSQDTINKDAASKGFSGSAKSADVDKYEGYWYAISSSVSAATAAVNKLSSSCSAQSSAAQSALLSEINPVMVKAQLASTTIANARAMINKVQAELNSNQSGSYQADLQALQAMPPTAEDLANAEHDSITNGAALATPTGSLSVSGGSTVDQMRLITNKAQALQSTCGVGVPII